MIIILIVFICSLIYYTLHSKKITDNEFYILVFLFMIVLLFLNRNKFMEEFSIGEESTVKKTQFSKINTKINKGKILEISNKILDKTIDNTIKLYKKGLEIEKKYKLKSKLKEHISTTKTFLKNKISSLKTSS